MVRIYIRSVLVYSFFLILVLWGFQLGMCGLSIIVIVRKIDCKRKDYLFWVILWSLPFDIPLDSSSLLDSVDVLMRVYLRLMYRSISCTRKEV